MKNKLLEQLTMITSLSKWTVYAAVVGIIAGISTTVFLKLLGWATAAWTQYHYYYLMLPLTFLVSTLLVQWLAPEVEGGTDKVIEAVHQHMGKLSINDVPVKLIATVITIATGGSAGKEGPAAQIGGTLASAFGDIIKVNGLDRKKLVICGVSAGFSAVFGTPIAGALFGVEVLYLGHMLYDVLYPAFIAGLIGYHVSTALGINYFYHPIAFTAPSFFSLKQFCSASSAALQLIY